MEPSRKRQVGLESFEANKNNYLWDELAEVTLTNVQCNHARIKKKMVS